MAESKDNKKTIKVWVGMNKNGFLVIFSDKPVRDKESGKWLGTMYANSVIYKMVKELLEKTSYSWNNEPEYFEFSYS